MTSQSIKLIFAAAVLALLVPYLFMHVIFQDRSLDEMRASRTVVVNSQAIPKVPRNSMEVAGKKIYGQFIDENPDVFVDSFTGLTIQHISGADEIQYIMAFAADRAPDVVFNNMENINTNINEGFNTPYLTSEVDLWLEDNLLAPLRSGLNPDLLKRVMADEAELAKGNLTGEAFDEARRGLRLKAAISPGLLENIYRQDEKTGRMQLWSLPQHKGDLMGISCRSAMLSQSGLVDADGQPQAPANWDEIEQWSIRIALQDRRWSGWMLPVGSLGDWPMPVFIWQGGGRIAKTVPGADGRTRQECALDEWGTIHCMTWYQKWATLKVEVFPRSFTARADGRDLDYRVFRTTARNAPERYFRLQATTTELSYYRLTERVVDGKRQLVDASRTDVDHDVVIVSDMNAEAFQRQVRELEVRLPAYVSEDWPRSREAFTTDLLAMRFSDVASLEGERNLEAQRRAAFPAGPFYRTEPRDLDAEGMPGWVSFGPGVLSQRRQIGEKHTEYQAALEVEFFPADTQVDRLRVLPNGLEDAGSKATLAQMAGEPDTMVRLPDGREVWMHDLDAVRGEGDGGPQAGFNLVGGPIYSELPEPLSVGSPFLRFRDGLVVREEQIIRREGYRIRASLTNCGMAGVNHLLADTSDPETLKKRNAVVRFIRYISGPEATRIRVESAVELGEGKYQNTEELIMLGYEQIANEQEESWQTFNRDIEKYARAVPTLPNYRDFQRELSSLLDSTCMGDRIPVREAVGNVTRSANVLHFGGEPEEVMQGKRRWAWGIAGGFVLVLIGLSIVGGRNLVAVVASDKAKHDVGELKKVGARDHMIAWVFLGPAVATVLLWQYVPLVQGSIMAFFDFHVVKESTFLGMDNWILIFSNPDFWPMMLRTILYVLIAIGLGFFVPIILALLLNEVPKGKVLFRTLFYLPAITSGLIILFMWKQFYKPDADGMLNKLSMGAQRGYNSLWDGLNHWRIGFAAGEEPWQWITVFWLPVLAMAAWGVIEIFRVRRQNLDVDQARADTWGIRPAESIVKRTFWLPSLLLFLGAVGLLLVCFATFARPTKVEALKWLQDPKWAMLSIILPGIWASAGPSCLIYLAGLKSIPEEEYEAADLDGAGPMRKTWAITLPRLSALILINFVGAFITAFQAHQNVLVMTGGGPNNQTMVLGLEIWMKAFVAIKFGYATALAWIMGLMLLCFTMIQLNTLKKVSFSTAGAGR